MKKIKIKCINKCKYQIIIYDHCGNKVFDDFTDYDGCLFFDVPYYGVYRILIIKNKNIRINTNFYVSKDNYEYCFRIDNVKKEFHLVTFKITDKNYNGLPIKEGKITLCQKNT